MHLPNHPDTLYEYIRALKSCGYRWLLVQEHTVERLGGGGLHDGDRYLPNRLIARNSKGEEISITALIKTQGSDTKLVAQMQPYHEAKGKQRQVIGGIEVPSLVSQIADGENGGVMMNEFPRDFPPTWYQVRDANEGIVGFNGSEYLELLDAAGVSPEDYPTCQAVGQAKIWQHIGEQQPTPELVSAAIAHLQDSDHQFHMDGASWTNDLSWVNGYENVLGPMQQLSVRFHRRYSEADQQSSTITRTPDYQQALLYNLLLQTSCFRYWGQGTWTDYARTLFEKGCQYLPT